MNVTNMYRFICLFTSLIISNVLYAQDRYTPELDVMKPNEMSEFSYSNPAEADLSTGALNINVPIYTIEQDGVQLPIQLNYNYRGIKVNEEASFVGLGWDLKLPSIFQVINDEDDLERFKDNNFYEPYLLPYQEANSPFQKDLQFNSVLFAYKVFGSINLSSGGKAGESAQYFVSTRKEVPLDGTIYSASDNHFSSYSNPIPDIFAPRGFGVDTEPDYFSVFIDNKEIKFMYDLEGNDIILLNDDLYEVFYDAGSNEFRIITPAEVIYEFSEYRKVMMFSSNDSFDNVNVGGTGGHTYNSEWLISKIITSKGSEITFSYDRIEANMNPEKDNSNHLGWKLNERDGQFSVQSSDNGSSGDEMSSAGANGSRITGAQSGIIESYSKVLADRLYINEISFGKGELNFSYSNRNDVASYQNATQFKKLVGIDLRNYLGEDIENFSFDYSLFTSTVNGNRWRENVSEDLIRLKLDGISRNGELYRGFEYNSLNLPSKASYATDYWGYYNGKLNNNSYAPNPQRFMAAGILASNYTSYDNSNNHSSVEYYAKACSLEKIVKPTKGYEKFYFELNKFKSNSKNRVPNTNLSNQSIVIGAGLRVGKIELFDNLNDILITRTEFKYDYGTLPNFLEFFKTIGPNYRSTIGSNVITRYYQGLICSQTSFFNAPLFMSDNIVFYPKVVEKKIDVNNASNSYSVESRFQTNEFDYFPNYAVGTSNYYEVYNPALINRSNYANGTLLEKKFFNSENVLIKSLKYEYVKRKSDIFYGIKTRFVGVWSGYETSVGVLHIVPRYSIEYYPIFFDKDYLNEIIVSEIIEGESITTTEERYYDSKWRLRRNKTTYNSSNSSDVYYSYHDDYLVNSPRLISTYNVKNGNLTNHYEYFKYNMEYNTSYYRTGYVLKGKYSCKESGGYTDDSCTKTLFTKYDDNLKLVEFQNGDHPKTVIIWGYNGEYPLAEIKNSSYEDITSALSVSDAQLNDFDESDLATINELRTNPLFKDSMITTYTYEPLVGMTSMTDARGRTTTYHYDDFGRLESTRDADNYLLEEYNYHYRNQ